MAVERNGNGRADYYHEVLFSRDGTEPDEAYEARIQHEIGQIGPDDSESAEAFKAALTEAQEGTTRFVEEEIDRLLDQETLSNPDKDYIIDVLKSKKRLAEEKQGFMRQIDERVGDIVD